MCIATRLVNELENTSEKINQEWLRLSKLLSKLDKKVSKCYHKIEQANFNAAEGYCLARELQIVLRQRRVVKEEMESLKVVKGSLNTKDLEKSIPHAKTNLSKHKERKRPGIEKWKAGWKDHFRVEDMTLTN